MEQAQQNRLESRESARTQQEDRDPLEQFNVAQRTVINDIAELLSIHPLQVPEQFLAGIPPAEVQSRLFQVYAETKQRQKAEYESRWQLRSRPTTPGATDTEVPQYTALPAAPRIRSEVHVVRHEAVPVVEPPSPMPPLPPSSGSAPLQGAVPAIGQDAAPRAVDPAVASSAVPGISRPSGLDAQQRHHLQARQLYHNPGYSPDCLLAADGGPRSFPRVAASAAAECPVPPAQHTENPSAQAVSGQHAHQPQPSVSMLPPGISGYHPAMQQSQCWPPPFGMPAAAALGQLPSAWQPGVPVPPPFGAVPPVQAPVMPVPPQHAVAGTAAAFGAAPPAAPAAYDMYPPNYSQPAKLKQLTDEATAALKFVPRYDGKGPITHWKQRILQAVTLMPAALPESEKALLILNQKVENSLWVRSSSSTLRCPPDVHTLLDELERLYRADHARHQQDLQRLQRTAEADSKMTAQEYAKQLLKAYETNNMLFPSGKEMQVAVEFFPVKFRKDLRSALNNQQVSVDDWTYELLQRCCRTVDRDLEEESQLKQRQPRATTAAADTQQEQQSGGNRGRGRGRGRGRSWYGGRGRGSGRHYQNHNTDDDQYHDRQVHKKQQDQQHTQGGRHSHSDGDQSAELGPPRHDGYASDGDGDARSQVSVGAMVLLSTSDRIGSTLGGGITYREPKAQASAAVAGHSAASSSSHGSIAEQIKAAQAAARLMAGSVEQPSSNSEATAAVPAQNSVSENSTADTGSEDKTASALTASLVAAMAAGSSAEDILKQYPQLRLRYARAVEAAMAGFDRRAARKRPPRAVEVGPEDAAAADQADPRLPPEISRILHIISKAVAPAALADLAALQGAEELQGLREFLAIFWRLLAAAQHRLPGIAPAAACLQACVEHLEPTAVFLESSKVEPGTVLAAMTADSDAAVDLGCSFTVGSSHNGSAAAAVPHPSSSSSSVLDSRSDTQISAQHADLSSSDGRELIDISKPYAAAAKTAFVKVRMAGMPSVQGYWRAGRRRSPVKLRLDSGCNFSCMSSQHLKERYHDIIGPNSSAEVFKLHTPITVGMFAGKHTTTARYLVKSAAVDIGKGTYPQDFLVIDSANFSVVLGNDFMFNYAGRFWSRDYTDKEAGRRLVLPLPKRLCQPGVEPPQRGTDNSPHWYPSQRVAVDYQVAEESWAASKVTELRL